MSADGLTLTQIRNRLKLQGKGDEGWYTAPAFTIADTIVKQNLREADWYAMTYVERTWRIAYQGVRNTMANWEQAEQEKKMRKGGKHRR